MYMYCFHIPFLFFLFHPVFLKLCNWLTSHAVKFRFEFLVTKNTLVVSNSKLKVCWPFHHLCMHSIIRRAEKVWDQKMKG